MDGTKTSHYNQERRKLIIEDSTVYYNHLMTELVSSPSMGKYVIAELKAILLTVVVITLINGIVWTFGDKMGRTLAEKISMQWTMEHTLCIVFTSIATFVGFACCLIPLLFRNGHLCLIMKLITLSHEEKLLLVNAVRNFVGSVPIDSLIEYADSDISRQKLLELLHNLILINRKNP